jgi:hypothetical protein
MECQVTLADPCLLRNVFITSLGSSSSSSPLAGFSGPELPVHSSHPREVLNAPVALAATRSPMPP